MPRPTEGFLGTAWQRVLVFDGAMGTSIQALGLAPGAFGDHPGCNEYLNLSRPGAIRTIHEQFLDAGADVIETNTFGGARHTLAEHRLEDRCEELNRAAARIARQAAGDRSSGARPRYVAGSIGPGSKLPSLGHTDFRALRDSYLPQVAGLAEGGVDCLLVETCQDMLLARAVLAAVRDALAAAGRDLPVLVQFTLDRNGRTLTGSDVAAILATFEPLGVCAIGLNCGTGPEPLAGAVRYLAAHSSCLLSVMPNAGLPRVREGKATYDLAPAGFSRQMSSLARETDPNIVGGCCGTTPEHIAALAGAFRDRQPRGPARSPARLSSLYEEQPIDVRPKPLICGERSNATGSRKFRQLLEAGDYDAMAGVAAAQADEGAHLADLSVACAGRDEARDMAELARRLNTGCRLPVMVDSTDPDVVEAALDRLAGRCVVNSVNLEDGGTRARRTIDLCRRCGAALVCMTIDEEGMAMTASGKLAVARRLYDLALEGGLAPDSLFFDFLTFTLASGDEKLRDTARETLAALGGAAARLPGAYTVLGVSNVSHGLEPPVRRVLNSVFLHRALERGLDAAILHAGKVVPLHRLSDREVELCDDLLFNRDTGERTPLQRLVDHFSPRERRPAPAGAERIRSPGELILAGETEGLEAGLDELRRKQSPLDIVNRQILPAMAEVGRLFEAGEMLLPFVLRSAEVTKRALDLLTPHLDRTDAGSPGTVVLATVRGDIHDIGKNLVGMILSANGFRVVDLGVRQGPEVVLAAVREHRPLAVGLSGLLVESARAMKEYLALFAGAGLRLPVLCGGAALTERYVVEELQPLYPGPVHYAGNAMDGLRILREVAERPGPPAPAPPAAPAPQPLPAATPRAVTAAPRRLTTRRYTRRVAPARLLALVDRRTLFAKRWQLGAGDQDSGKEPDRMLARIWREHRDAFAPRMRFAFFRATAAPESVILSHLTSGRRLADLGFSPGFLDRARERFGSEPFTVALQLATVGPGAGERGRELAGRGKGEDQFLLHGLAAELTEALAAHCQGIVQGLAGWTEAQRYSPGYPVWPELAEQQQVFRLLEPAGIGVTLTETFQMVPEYSTSAVVVPVA